jgi:DNA polymerase III alpha subunit
MKPPSFWFGLLRGFLIFFRLIGSLFTNVRVYAFPNSGAWYDFGYFLGVAMFFDKAVKRAEMQRLNIKSAAELRATAIGKEAMVAGSVITRQRPGTATGLIFLTLEDETGNPNIIGMPDVYEKNRRRSVGAEIHSSIRHGTEPKRHSASAGRAC